LKTIEPRHQPPTPNSTHPPTTESEVSEEKTRFLSPTLWQRDEALGDGGEEAEQCVGPKQPQHGEVSEEERQDEELLLDEQVQNEETL
jgi:hypothetical protein